MRLNILRGYSHKSWRWFGGLGAAVVVALSSGCSRTSNTPAEAQGQAASSPSAVAQTAPNAVAFDADHAYRVLQAQCDFGPRPMGSDAHTKCREFLIEQLQPLVDDFATQDWAQLIPRGPGAGHTYKMTNILGIIRGKDVTAATEAQSPKLMLCAHWDTRPVADMDPLPANRKKPILGADDGASGVAVLLEMARVLKANRPTQTVVIALWDAEDLGEFFYGARYFANSSSTPVWRKWRPTRSILLDMIGDSDLHVNHETNSLRLAPDLFQQVLDAAADLGQADHFNGPDIEVEDDHLPMNEVGIPSIDLIDFNYRPWHTLDDTPDKCSPASLKVIGDVLLRVCDRAGKV